MYTFGKSIMKTMERIAFKLATLLLAALLLFTHCDDNPVDVESPEQIAETLVKETNLDSLTLAVQQISGEVTVTINGTATTISSRHKDYPGNELAAEYIAQRLARYGLQVADSRFGKAGRSVYATQLGARYPDESYIICAHYDCQPSRATAPGADDNASGTAAVLEVARLLSEYETDYTVIYALWDEEEQGLIGSRHYASQASAANATILGVINLDMIGWDSDNNGNVVIDFNDMPASIQLAEHAVDAIERFDLGLNPLTTISVGRSDHVSFWNNGYAAIMIIEHFGADFNLYYHTAEDKLAYLNLPYFHKCARLAMATLAGLAIVE